MAELKSCETCAYVAKSENDYPCSKCTRNASDQWRPMSNADKIRAMDDEELAEFLHDYINHTCSYCKECKSSCTKQNLEWLQSEAE